ncbi:MAG: electron transporter RnfD [Eubacteriales bacterium]|nr:electron transporter RnfD [Eubacteriales bacterium]
MIIYPNNSGLRYMGRIDFKDPTAPVFIFPGTSVCMKFTGNRLKIFLKNKRAYWDNYIGYFLDGKQGCAKLPEEGAVVLDLSDQLGAEGAAQNDTHEILLFKRQDACHEVTFCGFELADHGRVLPLKELPERKLEVYGDSVSAGEVSEAVQYTGKEDPSHKGEFSNSWYSFAWMTARKLNAQIHDIAQGGIALLDGTGWFQEPDYIGMERIWDKLHYHPAFGKAVSWDFTNYIPQAVVIALGQNDSHPDDYMKRDYDCEKAIFWRKRYKEFIQKIRKQYPKAYIICCTTLLSHDASWDRAIDQVCTELDDGKVTHYIFKRNGTGTPGHLRISEAEEMAEELSAYIEQLSIEGWE